jgi:hypothetical protein
MEQIVICGNRVELQEVKTVQAISAESFKQSLRKTMGVVTPVLPKRVVLYAAKNNKQFYLVEKEPCVEKIKARKSRTTPARRQESDAGVIEHTICFPWVYFLLTFTGAAFDELRIFFTKLQITDTKDDLYYPPLPNLGNDCVVCLGGDFRFSIEGTMQAKISKVVSYYFGSEFNSDMNSVHNTRMPKEILKKQTQNGTLFEAWEIATREGAEPCALSWHRYKSLQEVIEEIIGEEEQE